MPLNLLTVCLRPDLQSIFAAASLHLENLYHWVWIVYFKRWTETFEVHTG